MAVPPKPVTDNVITAAWGGAVHDKVFSLAWKKLTKTTDPGGAFTVTAPEMGLTTFDGVFCIPISGAYHFQISAGGTTTWQFHALGQVPTQPAVPNATITLMAVAFVSVAATARPGEELPEIELHEGDT